MANSQRPERQRVADHLRVELERGDYADGELVGRRADLAERFGVSDITIRGAVALLAQQGLVRSQLGPGGGVLAQVSKPVPRLTHERYIRHPHGADTTAPSGPTDYDQAAGGQAPGVNIYWARRIVAPLRVAERLGLNPGAEVVQIDYVFYTAGRTMVLQASTSWEPLALVGGTTAEITGSGDQLYGKDVISRMDRIGVRVVNAVEETTAIAANGDHADLLQMVPGGPILLVERTQFDSDGNAVEIADILLPGHLHRRVDYIAVNDAEA